MSTDEQVREETSEAEETIMLRGKMKRSTFAEIQRRAAMRRVSAAVMVGELLRAGLDCSDEEGEGT